MLRYMKHDIKSCTCDVVTVVRESVSILRRVDHQQYQYNPLLLLETRVLEYAVVCC